MEWKEQDGWMLNAGLKQEQAAESGFLQHSQPQTTEGLKIRKKSGPPHHAVIGARPFCSPEYSPDFYKLGSTLPCSTYSMPYSEKRRLLDTQEEMEEVKQLDEWRPTTDARHQNYSCFHLLLLSRSREDVSTSSHSDRLSSNKIMECGFEASRQQKMFGQGDNTNVAFPLEDHDDEDFGLTWPLPPDHPNDMIAAGDSTVDLVEELFIIYAGINIPYPLQYNYEPAYVPDNHPEDVNLGENQVQDQHESVDESQFIWDELPDSDADLDALYESESEEEMLEEDDEPLPQANRKRVREEEQDEIFKKRQKIQA
ncbi:hypothetical protein GBF38_005732 [Nibea albiflora]|uniref:Uncharacterized protein n=1 Tax=Nibea albiflora TaxID=240163 RepID=A0ACB7F9D1_NIBAL|nr:hypothetical protein GBF38_005732 [Nibea albiflora]